MTDYGIQTTVDLPFAEAVSRTRAALAEQGFGILTKIDVSATMKAKLDVVMPPHVILGACNPPLAHRALTLEPSIGLLLPCNVVVRVAGTRTVVEAMDPAVMVSATGNTDLAEVADQAREGLSRAIEMIGSSASVPSGAGT